MRILNANDLEDFIEGAKIVGTGGGGVESGARRYLQLAKELSGEFKICGLDELPSDGYVIGLAGVGGGVSDEVRKKFIRRDRLDEPAILLAAKGLMEHLKRKPVAFCCLEIGAGNTVGPLFVSRYFQVPLIDGDTVGRAIPEMAQTTFNIKKVPSTPFILASPFGDVLLCKKVVDYERMEDISRSFAVACGGGCGFAHAIDAKCLKGVMVEDSVSWTMSIGRAVRQGRENESNPVQALVESSGGKILFQGRVTKFERREEGAFMWGKQFYEGYGDFEGKRYTIWFKNENHILWEGERVIATSPDLICPVDAKTAEGLSNWFDDFYSDREVTVVGIPAKDIWRTPEGVKILGPPYFGFDSVGYEPLVIKKE